jgi:hypothetical protein
MVYEFLLAHRFHIPCPPNREKILKSRQILIANNTLAYDEPRDFTEDSRWCLDPLLKTVAILLKNTIIVRKERRANVSEFVFMSWFEQKIQL